MAETTIKKNQTAEIPTKSGSKYSYQYVDIAQIHDYLEENHMKYYQYIERINDDDYIMTQRLIQKQNENGEYIDSFVELGNPLRGSRVVDATLYGNDNPAQKQGSAITYARRYSLLMAFGLATEDDDANGLNNEKRDKKRKKTENNKITEIEAKSVYSLMIRKGYDVVPTLKKFFKVSNTKDLSKKQYLEIVSHCNTLPDKNKDNKAELTNEEMAEIYYGEIIDAGDK